MAAPAGGGHAAGWRSGVASGRRRRQRRSCCGIRRFGKFFHFRTPMTRRLAILLAVLTLGFSAYFALPRRVDILPTAMPGGLWKSSGPDDRWDLPKTFGLFEWSGTKALRPSINEVTVLAQDTKFAKRNYLRELGSADMGQGKSVPVVDELSVVVVTSGSDMGNSIHRPERCLLAQGFSILQMQKFVLKVRGNPLPVQKLRCRRTGIDQQTGRSWRYDNVTYYWFVGNQVLTNSHWTRTLVDMKDRLFKGEDQEWAYASVALGLDPHRVVVQSRYDSIRREAARRLGAKSLGKEDHDQVMAVLELWDDLFLTDEEYARKVAEFVEKKSPELQSLLAETRPFAVEEKLAVTNAIDDDKVGADGLSDADRLMQRFIVDLAQEVIDPTMIEAWKRPSAAHGAPASAAR
jgi:hypothetical protein